MKKVAKIFIRTPTRYVMSRKRAPGEAKDNRLEHLGGKMERGETPLDALIREVGPEEEEKTGKLAEEVKRQRPEPRRVQVGRQPHFIFEVLLTEELAESLEADSEESYCLELVKAENLDTDEGLVSFSSELTPKTLAIYRALGRPV